MHPNGFVCIAHGTVRAPLPVMPLDVERWLLHDGPLLTITTELMVAFVFETVILKAACTTVGLEDISCIGNVPHALQQPCSVTV